MHYLSTNALYISFSATITSKLMPTGSQAKWLRTMYRTTNVSMEYGEINSQILLKDYSYTN